MIDLYLWMELATFARTGTLAQTATALNVTQPTVTRGMQKLEDLLGVTLFDRHPNRLALTPTGQLAATLAQQLVTANDQAVAQIHTYDQEQQTFIIKSTLPGPLLLIDRVLNITAHQTEFDPNLVPDQTLLSHAASLVLSSHGLTTKQIESQYLGTESLAVNLDQFMYHANQATIRFQELRGLSFLVLQDIGQWRDIIQDQIPGANFLYQAEHTAFTEITQYSDFPYFSTNLSTAIPADQAANDNRVRIPISDTAAQMPIYASYLRSQRQRVMPVLTMIRQAWPEAVR